MIEVYPNLFVGSAADYEREVHGQAGWCVVHACKEPYHRQALGYSGGAAPRSHPEYLVARRGDRLVLNFVDAPDPRYVPRELVDAALELSTSDLPRVHACSSTAIREGPGRRRWPFSIWLGTRRSFRPQLGRRSLSSDAGIRSSGRRVVCTDMWRRIGRSTRGSRWLVARIAHQFCSP